MKAFLYATQQGQGTAVRWHVSLELAIDYHFWFNLQGVTSLLLVKPSVALGQALKLQEQWNEHTGKLPAMPIVEVCADERIKRSLQERVQLTVEQVEQVRQSMLGRSLLFDEAVQYFNMESDPKEMKALLQWAYLHEAIQFRPGMNHFRRKMHSFLKREDQVKLRCYRCHSMDDDLHESDCARCGESCAYCTQCMTMGKIRSCSLIIEGGSDAMIQWEDNQWTSDQLEDWKLSPAQFAAAHAGIQFLQTAEVRQEFLIWAVTGSGKTEMTFALMDYTLKRGGQVVLASPRRDVVLELQPRVKRAFPDLQVVTLYGGSTERWEKGQITLATTHQLFRFQEMFDLVIIDELDAFPFHGDETLRYAAQRVCKRSGKFIYLTATPPKDIQTKLKRGIIQGVRVPVRYHRHPLPVPHLVKIAPISKLIQSTMLPKPLLKWINQSLQRGAQIFLFVPQIKQVSNIVQMLRSHYADLSIDGTSSRDDERAEKVTNFREGKIKILVTTTILERGVTVPKTDVMILDTHSSLFSDAALVQMAGRAGRSPKDPRGIVVFFRPHETQQERDAMRQIKTMNRLASKAGYLLNDEEAA